jgi:hypothetical protein
MLGKYNDTNRQRQGVLEFCETQDRPILLTSGGLGSGFAFRRDLISIFENGFLNYAGRLPEG